MYASLHTYIGWYKKSIFSSAVIFGTPKWETSDTDPSLPSLEPTTLFETATTPDDDFDDDNNHHDDDDDNVVATTTHAAFPSSKSVHPFHYGGSCRTVDGVGRKTTTTTTTNNIKKGGPSSASLSPWWTTQSIISPHHPSSKQDPQDQNEAYPNEKDGHPKVAFHHANTTTSITTPTAINNGRQNRSRTNRSSDDDNNDDDNNNGDEPSDDEEFLPMTKTGNKPTPTSNNQDRTLSRRVTPKRQASMKSAKYTMVDSDDHSEYEDEEMAGGSQDKKPLEKKRGNQLKGKVNTNVNTMSAARRQSKQNGSNPKPKLQKSHVIQKCRSSDEDNDDDDDEREEEDGNISDNDDLFKPVVFMKKTPPARASRSRTKKHGKESEASANEKGKDEDDNSETRPVQLDNNVQRISRKSQRRSSSATKVNYKETNLSEDDSVSEKVESTQKSSSSSSSRKRVRKQASKTDHDDIEVLEQPAKRKPRVSKSKQVDLTADDDDDGNEDCFAHPMSKRKKLSSDSGPRTLPGSTILESLGDFSLSKLDRNRNRLSPEVLANDESKSSGRADDELKEASDSEEESGSKSSLDDNLNQVSTRLANKPKNKRGTSSVNSDNENNHQNVNIDERHDAKLVSSSSKRKSSTGKQAELGRKAQLNSARKTRKDSGETMRSAKAASGNENAVVIDSESESENAMTTPTTVKDSPFRSRRRKSPAAKTRKSPVRRVLDLTDDDTFAFLG